MTRVIPVAFMSYAHFDDRNDSGYLSKLRSRLSDEVQAQTGGSFDIFQDGISINWGQQWKLRIEESLNATTFLLAIITPSFFNSHSCCDEMYRFLTREKQLGRNDLILPLYYITCPQFEDTSNELAQEIKKRQWADWRQLRHKSLSSPKTRQELTKLAGKIATTLSAGDNSVGGLVPPDHNQVQPENRPNDTPSIASKSASIEKINSQIRALHLINKASDAMEKDNVEAAQSFTEHAIELCPDVEVEGRSTLALWMSEKAVLDFASATRGDHNPKYRYYAPEPNDLTDLCYRATQHLRRMLELVTEDYGHYLSALARVHGVQGRYNDMMAVLRDVAVADGQIRASLAMPDNLAALAHACANTTEPETALLEVGRELEIRLPSQQSDVLASIMALSLAGRQISDHNAYWYVMTKPFVSNAQAVPYRIASLHIRGHDVGNGLHALRLVQSFCHIPGVIGPIVQIPSGPDEPAQHVVEQLAERFIFITQR